MTILEAIQKVDAIKPNTYQQLEKIAWLSKLDGIIKTQIIDTHKGWEEVNYKPYTDETSLNTELLVPSPYDSIYESWLESQIDYANGEYVKYNNSITRYNEDFSAYSNYYNSIHMPLGNKIRYW